MIVQAGLLRLRKTKGVLLIITVIIIFNLICYLIKLLVNKEKRISLFRKDKSVYNTNIFARISKLKIEIINDIKFINLYNLLYFVVEENIYKPKLIYFTNKMIIFLEKLEEKDGLIKDSKEMRQACELIYLIHNLKMKEIKIKFYRNEFEKIKEAPFVLWDCAIQKVKQTIVQNILKILSETPVEEVTFDEQINSFDLLKEIKNYTFMKKIIFNHEKNVEEYIEKDKIIHFKSSAGFKIIYLLVNNHISNYKYFISYHICTLDFLVNTDFSKLNLESSLFLLKLIEKLSIFNNKLLFRNFRKFKEESVILKLQPFYKCDFLEESGLVVDKVPGFLIELIHKKDFYEINLRFYSVDYYTFVKIIYSIKENRFLIGHDNFFIAEDRSLILEYVNSLTTNHEISIRLDINKYNDLFVLTYPHVNEVIFYSEIEYYSHQFISGYNLPDNINSIIFEGLTIDFYQRGWRNFVFPDNLKVLRLKDTALYNVDQSLNLTELYIEESVTTVKTLNFLCASKEIKLIYINDSTIKEDGILLPKLSTLRMSFDSKTKEYNVLGSHVMFVESSDEEEW